MQTFITDFDMTQNAKNLDNKRLGKQRVEALQIASCLLVKETRWKNHPAVKMWINYESFLLREYLHPILIEWESKKFKNELCAELYLGLLQLVISERPVKPHWLTSDFIEAHRSNLIRKNPEYYKPLFPDTKENLPYIWPVK